MAVMRCLSSAAMVKWPHRVSNILYLQFFIIFVYFDKFNSEGQISKCRCEMLVEKYKKCLALWKDEV